MDQIVKLIDAAAAKAGKTIPKLELTLEERHALLSVNAMLFASGRINLEASTWLYNKLQAWDSTSAAERFVVTKALMVARQ